MTAGRVSRLLVVSLAALLAACGSSSKSSSGIQTLADGNYVFHLAGTDYNTSQQFSSPYFVAGAFTVSKGLITQGEEDFVDYKNVFATVAIDPSGSSIGTTADGNLQIKFYTGGSGQAFLGINGTQTINASLVSSTSARIEEFDGSASGTGSLDMQSSVAQPSGSYAFFAAGLDTKDLPMALGGIINIDNLNGTTGTISGAGSIFDLNDAPTLGVFPAQTFAPSTVSAPDSFGRVVFTLNPTNGAIGAINLVGYVVSSTTIQLAETTDGVLGTLGGAALGQSSQGTFNPAGLTYVFDSRGQEQVGGAFATGSGYLNFAGALAFNSSAGVGGQVSFNDIATQVDNGSTNTASYAPDSIHAGRVSVTGLTTSDPSTPANLEFYLDGNGNGFVVSMDASDVTAGTAFQQASNPSVSGTYVLTARGTTLITSDNLTVTYPWSALGLVSASSGKATGFTDLNVLTNPEVTGTLATNVSLTGTSTGTGGVMTGAIGGLGYASTSNQYAYYVIDNNRALAIETDANQLSEAFAVVTSATK